MVLAVAIISGCLEVGSDQTVTGSSPVRRWLDPESVQLRDVI